MFDRPTADVWTLREFDRKRSGGIVLYPGDIDKLRLRYCFTYDPVLLRMLRLRKIADPSPYLNALPPSGVAAQLKGPMPPWQVTLEKTLREAFGQRLAGSARKACGKAYRNTGIRLEVSVSVACEWAATQGDKLSGHTPAYVSRSVTNAIKADRRKDGGGSWVRQRQPDGSQRWVHTGGPSFSEGIIYGDGGLDSIIKPPVDHQDSELVAEQRGQAAALIDIFLDVVVAAVDPLAVVVFRLRAMHSMKWKAISEETNLPLTTAKRKYYWTRGKVKAQFDSHEVPAGQSVLVKCALIGGYKSEVPSARRAQ